MKEYINNQNNSTDNTGNININADVTSQISNKNGDSINQFIDYDSSVYLVSRLFRVFLRPYYKKIALSILCMIFVALSTATNAWLMQPVLDDIFLNKVQ